MEEVKKINYDARSMVRNLCNWNIYFSLLNNKGDVMIKANGVKELLNSEIIAQVQNNSVFFVGKEDGSHARILIENPDLREYLGLDKQIVLTDDKCEYIIGLKTDKAFKENLDKYVVTKPEKDRIMAYARKTKLNDFDKIVTLEKHTGLKFRIEE